LKLLEDGTGIGLGFCIEKAGMGHGKVASEPSCTGDPENQVGEMVLKVSAW